MGMNMRSLMRRIDDSLHRRSFNPRSAILVTSIILVFASSSLTAPKSEQQPPLTIGVAQWRQEGGPFMDVQETTYRRLVDELLALDLPDVSVVRIPETLKNADQVDSVASEHNVDVVVWGWYDDTGVRGYVDLANATRDDGKTNCLSTFLERGGNTNVIRVLNILDDFDYNQDGVSFCVPRWTP